MSNKHIELIRALLDNLSIEDIETILQEKKNAQRVVTSKPKPLSKWKRYELYVETELKKILNHPLSKHSKQILLCKHILLCKQCKQ